MNKILALMLIAAFAVVAGCAKAPAMEEETTPAMEVEATAPAMEADATAPAMEADATAPAMEETAPAADASAATEVEVY